jgi:hypothetical protein
MATMQPHLRPTRVLPSNRRKVYLASFIITVAVRGHLDARLARGHQLRCRGLRPLGHRSCLDLVRASLPHPVRLRPVIEPGRYTKANGEVDHFSLHCRNRPRRTHRLLLDRCARCDSGGRRRGEHTGVHGGADVLRPPVVPRGGIPACMHWRLDEAQSRLTELTPCRKSISLSLESANCRRR